MTSDDARDAQEHGWRQLEQIENAYRSGTLDVAGWHQAVLDVIEPAYLTAPTVQGGSGHGGTAEQWERTRSIVMSAVDRSGSFLDIGCANGLLMESIARWAAPLDIHLEPYGVDISAALAERARTRCPQWAERIWCANAAAWHPPHRFDYVRTALDYVPMDRRAEYLQHLLDVVVAPGGRLVVGKLNELASAPPASAWAASQGFAVAGEVRRPSDHPQVQHTVFWIDGPDRADTADRAG